MFVKLLEFIHQVLSGLTMHPGVHWGKMEMMKPYSGWYGYIQNMFSNLGWGTIFLIVASALLWTAVYLVIIYRLHKDHAPSMPWVCLCMNFSWEFQFAFLVPYPEPITRWGIYLWVVFDAVMFILDYKYGKMFFAKRFPGYDWAYPWIKFGMFAILFVTILMMNPQWPILPDSPMFAAYLMNAIMSILFCQHMFHKETVEGLSIWVAWCKFLGTLAPTCIGLYWMPGQYFVYCLAAICAVFDICYITLLTIRFRQFGLNPYTHKPLKGREAEAEKTYLALEDYKRRSNEFKLKTFKECKVFLAEQANEKLNK